MMRVVFVQPFEVDAELAQQLEGRVVVLDVAFCADTPRSSFATTTLPFIQALGERLALWLDHHEHERHAEFSHDPRFVLASRKEHQSLNTPAHHAFTRLLKRQPLDKKALWQEAERFVDKKKGFMVLDDTTLDKPYTQKMELVTYH